MVRSNRTVEPIGDLLDLQGSLKTNVKATYSQIRGAFEKYIAQRRSSLFTFDKNLKKIK